MWLARSHLKIAEDWSDPISIIVGDLLRFNLSPIYMLYQFDFHPYRRPFAHPLTTSHGNWEVREGIILCLTDETGKIGWGEIAPIPWFGSETLEQALDFCQQLPPQITTTDIFSIPVTLPACQFGFESAWEGQVAGGLTPSNSPLSRGRTGFPLTKGGFRGVANS